MISPAKIKQDALAECERQHRTRFTRVGKSFTDRMIANLEASYRRMLKAEIEKHPSIGCTLK